MVLLSWLVLRVFAQRLVHVGLVALPLLVDVSCNVVHVAALGRVYNFVWTLFIQVVAILVDVILRASHA